MSATTFVVFWRCIGSFGVGASLGAAAAGVVAVVTGRVFATDSPWPVALPVLILIGAALTAVVSRLTRPWLLPQVTRLRWLWGAAAGVLLGPLAIAVGELGGLLKPVGMPLMLIGAMTTVVLWARWYRSIHRAAGVRTSMIAAR